MVTPGGWIVRIGVRDHMKTHFGRASEELTKLRGVLKAGELNDDTI